MSNKILVFAGTFEGHALAKTVSKKSYGKFMDFCVATEYGAENIEDVEGVNVIKGRKTLDDINSMIEENNYGMIIDSTHPYAKVVTENLKAAAQNKGIEYLRLLRESEDELISSPNVKYVKNIEDAVKVMENSAGRILLTTGSKDLGKFTSLKDFDSRIVARVLPSVESIELCREAGIAPKNIIAMQGPFTEDMNVATLKQYNCKILVTKDTGRPGGFKDKIKCAEMGTEIIVIERPTEEKGLSFEEVLERVDEFFE